MRLMYKLLDSLGDVWNLLPKSVPYVTIQRGTGAHTMVTVSEGALNFHSAPFRSNLPTKQEVLLDGMDTQTFIDTVQGMGYVVQLSDKALTLGLDALQPIVMIEVQDVRLDAELAAFTSNLWRRLYPIYRTLRKAENDIDLALKMLYADMATGDWLDYWADFFDMKRAPGEQDNDFVRRLLMWLFNPKTNNVALKELLAYQLKDNNIDVRDKAPAQFEVLVGVKYLSDASALHRILSDAKGAGIEYLLNYISDPYAEDYKVYLSDATGRPFQTLDELTIRMQSLFVESPYPSPLESYGLKLVRTETEEVTTYKQQSNIGNAFRVGSSRILTYKYRLVSVGSGSVMNDVATVTLTNANGEVVRSIVI